MALRCKDTVCPRAEHGFAGLRGLDQKAPSLEKPQPGLWEPVPFWIILLPLGLGKGLLENDLTIESGRGSAQGSVQRLPARAGLWQASGPTRPKMWPLSPLGRLLGRVE